MSENCFKNLCVVDFSCVVDEFRSVLVSMCCFSSLRFADVLTVPPAFHPDWALDFI